MSKFESASKEVIELFDKVRNSTAIPSWVQFEVLSNNKQKQVYQINKLNDLVQVLTDGVNFAVVFNEEIFTQLEEDQQIMVISECLAGVSVSDSDAVSLEKPNFSTYRGVLEKYGRESIITLHESIKSL
ncbi:MAG: putative metallopeptidase, partial [bacterium]